MICNIFIVNLLFSFFFFLLLYFLLPIVIHKWIKRYVSNCNFQIYFFLLLFSLFSSLFSISQFHHVFRCKKMKSSKIISYIEEKWRQCRFSIRNKRISRFIKVETVKNDGVSSENLSTLYIDRTFRWSFYKIVPLASIRFFVDLNYIQWDCSTR